ncbi:hypothetical protein [Helicobacter suis]|uniref:hypothetical protein n=1 Tax=Helicobacter suis TaxID=104628 RepID=UPI0013D58B7C|nr:hypothetical protein [Helicobacter suis]
MKANSKYVEGVTEQANVFYENLTIEINTDMAKAVFDQAPSLKEMVMGVRCLAIKLRGQRRSFITSAP